MKTPGHLQLQEIKLSSGQEWQDAGVDWRFLRMQSGAAYWMGAPRPRSLVDGEVIVAPPGVVAALRASQINDVQLHGFSFVAESLCGLLTLTERRFFERDGAPGAREPQFLPSTHPVAQRFAALVSREDLGERLSRRLEALCLVVSLFDSELVSQQAPEPLGPSVAYRFQQLISAMPDTELIHQSPAQLAQLCHCSARHFNRLFRKQFGISVRARQTELRLLKARQLLEQTEARVTEVARDSGYRNLGLFNSLFKRRFGMTPTEWRTSSARGNGEPAPGIVAAMGILFLVLSALSASAESITFAQLPETDLVPNSVSNLPHSRHGEFTLQFFRLERGKRILWRPLATAAGRP
jgi:AraC-like DNA-binding protein